MLETFIDTTLTHIDDLAELKVTLVALRLLAGKSGALVWVSERELLRHPAVQGLSFPDITVKLALQKAVARGSLLSAAPGGVPGGGELRYFVNTAQNREMVATLTIASDGATQARPFDAIRREMERIEVLEAYAFSEGDLRLLEEWTARGYRDEEIIAAIRSALHEPRPSSTPPRGISHIEGYLLMQPPQAPSTYFEVIVTRGGSKPSYVVAFRELTQRLPNASEFGVLQTAVALFGQRNVEEGLMRLRTTEGLLPIEGLIPLLSEQEESQLAFERGRAEVDLQLRDLIKLYEQVIGLPPTEYIARDMKSVYDSDAKDIATWKAVFEYAATQNKKDWRYIRALLLNPSPNVFMPTPANETAKQAFEDYRRRVGRLDPMVANEINQVAQQVTDLLRWAEAFDAAARANALNWNYIKKVLLSANDATGDRTGDKSKDSKRQTVKDGDRKPKRTPAKSGSGSTYRRPQVEYTDEQRAAARERARQLLAERKKKDGGGQ